MEQQLSDILDNILGLLLLEGSYEIEDTDEAILVSIDTTDAGRLIGARGESLEALQLLVSQILLRQRGGPAPSSTGVNFAREFKRVIFDVSGWRKQREEDLKRIAQDFGKQVLESEKEMELEPMSSWQRRVVHMVVGEMKGLQTESVGEGRDRHIIIKVKSAKGKGKSQKEELKIDAKTEES